jgi:hypothetical protein
MNAYLARLPRGLDSYPDYVQKASMYREFLTEVSEADRSLLPTFSGLPAVLAQLVREPVPVTSWVPEVHAYALGMAMADLFFASDDAFLDRKLQANRRILSGPLYRLLFLLISPARLLRNVVSRWEKFHRGLPLRVLDLQSNEGTVRLEFPHYMVPDLQVRTYALVLQAAVEAAGGKEASFGVESSGPTFAQYCGTWK